MVSINDRKLRLFSLVLAAIGLLDSIYLTWVKIANQYALCGPIGDCESVNSSQYSEIYGTPIALFGAGAYLIIILLLWLESRGGGWQEYGPMLVFGISFAGVLYSAYLTYIEIAVLRAICPYCVLSAVALVLLLILTILRLMREQDEFQREIMVN
ncbi:MAG TPA: vitamin K epoxide reductase family protein [Anaerolineales bacterium]